MFFYRGKINKGFVQNQGPVLSGAVRGQGQDFLSGQIGACLLYTSDALGAIVIGAVAGLLVVFGVWMLDHVLRIDDPVGAVAVHCMNGVWGTLAVGLFATDTAPGYSIANASGGTITGVFYGGGFELLGLQLVGLISVAAWTAVTITITFLIIKAAAGLRVDREEEITGLDATEHGLPSAYAGFAMLPEYIEEGGEPVVVSGDTPVAEAIPVKKVPAFEEGTPKFTKIEIICKLSLIHICLVPGA